MSRGAGVRPASRPREKRRTGCRTLGHLVETAGNVVASRTWSRAWSWEWSRWNGQAELAASPNETTQCIAIHALFLPERDLTLPLRLGLCYRKSVCLSSVTFVRPTQGVKTFGNIFSPFVPYPSFDLRAKFYGNGSGGTSPSGALNARGVAQ